MTADQYISKLQKLAETNNEPIPDDLIKAGIGREEVEVLALVYDVLHSPAIYSRITPALELKDFQALHLNYLPRCMRKNHPSEFVLSPYSAAHAITAWFAHLWEENADHKLWITPWKGVIGNIYASGDNSVREVIICGVLEHLFQHGKIMAFFNDWRTDPVLSKAYEEARFILFGQERNLE